MMANETPSELNCSMYVPKLCLITMFLLLISAAVSRAETTENLETPLPTDGVANAAQQCFLLASSVPEFRIEEQPAESFENRFKNLEKEESSEEDEQSPETLTDAEAQINTGTNTDTEDPCALAIQNNNQTPRDLAASYSNQGLILASKGEYGLAIQSHTLAVALLIEELEEDEESENIYINRGNAFFALQDYAGANADYSRAIVLSAGTNHQALYNRALVFKALGYKRRAFKELEHALLFAPHNSRYLASQSLLQEATPIPDTGEQEAYESDR